MNNTYNNKAFLLFLDHWNLLKELTPEEFMRVVQGIFSCPALTATRRRI